MSWAGGRGHLGHLGGGSPLRPRQVPRKQIFNFDMMSRAHLPLQIKFKYQRAYLFKLKYNYTEINAYYFLNILHYIVDLLLPKFVLY